MLSVHVCACASFFSWHHMVYCYMCVCVDGGKSDEDPREAHDDLRDGQDQPTRSVSMCRILLIRTRSYCLWVYYVGR